MQKTGERALDKCNVNEFAITCNEVESKLVEFCILFFRQQYCYNLSGLVSAVRVVRFAVVLLRIILLQL